MTGGRFYKGKPMADKGEDQQDRVVEAALRIMDLAAAWLMEKVQQEKQITKSLERRFSKDDG